MVERRGVMICEEVEGCWVWLRGVFGSEWRGLVDVLGKFKRCIREG